MGIFFIHVIGCFVGELDCLELTNGSTRLMALRTVYEVEVKSGDKIDNRDDDWHIVVWEYEFSVGVVLEVEQRSRGR